MSVVRIGGGQGFYGDGKGPVGPVLDAGVDYLVCEALAELTLAILQKDRQRDESLGWTRDLPVYVGIALPWLADGRTKMITNAGGINPAAAGRAVEAVLRDQGAGHLKVATVVGDDVRPHAQELRLPDNALFANAYLGARPIVEALAAGVVVGHLLECSGQVCGGNWSGPWWEHFDPLRIPFPIGEVEPDGTAVITKPMGTSGAVTFDTVREQLLYEVHDPARYLNPDVVADFTSPRVEDLGDDRVRLSGTRGSPAPPTYKGLVCTPAGWAGEARFAYSWPDAEAKARAAVGFVRTRAEAAGIAVEEWHEEYFGVDAYGGSTAGVPEGWDPPEVIGRLAWRCADEQAAGRVGRESGLLGLSGPPMISGFGRSRDGGPTQLLAVTPFEVPRPLVDAQTKVILP